MSAIFSNYTLQDIVGATAAFFLFPLVIVFPGYVVAWLFDLFDFRERLPVVKLGIGLVLSFSISPIIFDVISSLISLKFSLIVLGVFAIAFATILYKEKVLFKINPSRYIKAILWVGGVWSVFALLSLVDIQWKDQLYFSMVSFDQTSRVSVIDAMTRTGVPPINPGFYPGAPSKLTFLYYFWYILASQIDLLGGALVDARAALNASSAWTGLGLMATVALYLRQRNAHRGGTAWKSAWIGVVLLGVSGLDILIFALTPRNGNVEHWNNLQFNFLIWNNILFAIFTMIGTWISSILWAPHHIAAVIAGLTSVMLAHTARGKAAPRQITILLISGLGFASALGLSVWITIVYVVFWVIWISIIFIQKSERAMILPMILTGMAALLFSGPFLFSMFQGGGGGGGGQLPIVFEIRSFLILEPFVKEWSQLARSLTMLAILPFDLFIELGFFFAAGIYWFKNKDRNAILFNPYYLTETILFAVVLFFTSCLRSTLTNNDLGLRTWLVGQFILLVWGVEIVEAQVLNKGDTVQPRAVVNAYLLRALIAAGMLTSILDAVYLRGFWPAWAGAELGRSTYSARLAYDYLRDHIPNDVVVQNNPLIVLDRPSGLYGTHQMVIASRSTYGVTLETFNKFADDIGVLFTTKNISSWQFVDRVCEEYSIDLLIVNDTDPSWSGLLSLRVDREPLYTNRNYAIYACGDYAHGN